MAEREPAVLLREDTAPTDVSLGYKVPEDDGIEVKQQLIHLITGNTFGGAENENPNRHIAFFEETCETFKSRDTDLDKLKLKVFHLSLRDEARDWVRDLEQVQVWADLKRAFIEQYFPPSKVMELRDRITRFRQLDGEEMAAAWKRYQGILRACPHHGMTKTSIVSCFYRGLLRDTRKHLDAAAGGSLLNKDQYQAFTLIEEIARQETQWDGRDTNHRRAPGMYQVDSMDAINARLDALTVLIKDAHNPKPKQVHAIHSSPVSPCNTCGDPNHVTLTCPYNSGGEMEQANALNFNNPRPPFESYATYNPGMRHPNFSWRNDQNNQHQGNQNHYQGNQGRNHYQDRGNQQQHGPPQKSHLDKMMENLAASQAELTGQLTGITNQHKDFLTTQNKINQNMAEAVKDLTSKVELLTSQGRLMEFQLTRLVSQNSATTEAPTQT